MASDAFNESLTASLRSLRERLLNDHQIEVHRLQQVNKVLKSKIDRLSNKIMEGGSFTDDSSDGSSIDEVMDKVATLKSERHSVESWMLRKESDSERRSTLAEPGNSRSMLTYGTQQPKEACRTSVLMPQKPMGAVRRISRSLQGMWFGAPSSNTLKNEVVSLSQQRRVSRMRSLDDTALTRTFDASSAHSSARGSFNGLMGPNPLDLAASPSFQSHCSESETDGEFKLASAWRIKKKHQNHKGSMHRPSKPDDNISECPSEAAPKETSAMQLKSMKTTDFLNASLDDEDEEPHWMSRYIMQPSSLKHLCWSSCGLALIFYDAVVVPLEIFNPPNNAFFLTMLLISNVFWTLDIVGNFFVGYMNVDGTLCMKPKLIASRYAFTWLPLDVCLTICNWVALSTYENSDSSGVEVLDPWRTIAMLRLFRILRLLKAPEMEGFLSEHLRSETACLVVSIARLIVLLLLVAHIIACSWYGIGLFIANGGNSSAWVARYNLVHQGVWEKYSVSIHWSLSQFTGEHLIGLENVVERTFAIVIFIFAFLFANIFVSSITTLMTRLQIVASKQSSQISALRRYLHGNSISSSLAIRVLRNAQLSIRTNQQSVAEHSVELLQEISKPLQVELHFEVHFPTLAFHPFFKHYNIVNPADMRKVCHQAVSITWLSTHDVVFSENETPERAAMFFVVKGHLLYMQECVPGQISLCRGMWACENVLWTTSVQHTGTLAGSTESTLLSLDAHKFQRIVMHFPSPHAREYGRGYVRQMNSAIKEQGIDLLDIDVYTLCEEAFPESCVAVPMGRIGSMVSTFSTGDKRSVDVMRRMFSNLSIK